MNSKSILRSLFASLVFAISGWAQDQPLTEAEKTSQTLVDTYVAAFNKGDAKAIGALYAEDLEYRTDDGTPIAGRAAAVEGLTKFFAKNKGAHLDVKIESARFLTPDVLVEKGFATVDEETTRYVCNYVKKDGVWLIAELNETTLPPVDAAATQLEELAWLVGSWKDNTPEGGVTATTNWTKNRHFLSRSVLVKHGDETALDATEVIGYDPVAGQLHSWVFDSEGGFGDGAWTRDGNKWLVSFKSTAPDGSTSSAQHVLTYLDDKKYTWESINRQRDGEVLPSIDKIEVIRTADAPKE